MAVIKIFRFGSRYIQFFWEDNQSYFSGWDEDDSRDVDPQKIEDNPEHYYGESEPDWYREAE